MVENFKPHYGNSPPKLSGAKPLLPHGIDESASDALASFLTPPPESRNGVCSTCRTSTQEFALECENCSELREQLGVDPLRLDVISLYSRPSWLREILSVYKGRATQSASSALSVGEGAGLVKLAFDRFFSDYLGILTQIHGRIDALVVVPSSLDHPPHPLHSLVSSIGLQVPTVELLRRGTGRLGFRQASHDGFVTTSYVNPRRVYLIDDVYTTGARLNSAAFAIRAGGHIPIGGLVLARRINPTHSDHACRLWSEQTSKKFRWSDGPVIANQQRAYL